MAIGNTSALTTGNKTAVDVLLAQDALYVRSFYDWVKRKYADYNTNLSTTAQQSGAGYSVAGDQTLITAFIGDLNRLQQTMEGTNPGSFVDMRNDLAVMLGLS